MSFSMAGTETHVLSHLPIIYICPSAHLHICTPIRYARIDCV